MSQLTQHERSMEIRRRELVAAGIRFCESCNEPFDPEDGEIRLLTVASPSTQVEDGYYCTGCVPDCPLHETPLDDNNNCPECQFERLVIRCREFNQIHHFIFGADNEIPV